VHCVALGRSCLPVLESLTGYKALKVFVKSCAAVRTGLNLLWCRGHESRPADVH